jgi:uncharacterized protein (TIGR03083 family)
MTSTGIHDKITAERADLLAILDSLDPAEWDAPSLCEGWRIREVVAHMTFPFRYSPPRVVFELIRSRGDINRLADRFARHDAGRLSAADLTTALRANLDHPWKPPGGGFEGTLAHEVIHGLDITVALGLDRKVPEDRLRIVLDGTGNPRTRKFFGTDLSGVRLRADDLDWTFDPQDTEGAPGAADEITGAAQDLLLVVCGRLLPREHLHGPQADRFTRRG